MKSVKVVIIGAGHVGSHCGYALCQYGDVNEIVYIDVDVDKAYAQAADIADAGIFMPHPVTVRSGTYEACDDADIIVLSAGVPRREGQTRLDTLGDSIEVMKKIIPHLKASRFSGIMICISNPADIIAHYMYTHLGWDKNRIFSTGTGLDTARCKRALKEALNVDPRMISCYVLGEHGDSSMIPFSSVQIGGKSLAVLKSEGHERFKRLDEKEILHRTRFIGMEVVMGKGSTEFGIATVLANLVRCIVHDTHAILPVSARLEGEYGHFGIHIGVPAIIGRNGIEEIIVYPLTQDEQDQFDASCKVIDHHISLAMSL
jgi:L-lactate dehydrogenase